MTDRHEHLDEGTIHAWLDGELPPDESARVEAQVSACTECAALVAEARGLVAASSRILSSLDAVPGGVIPGVESGTDQLAALRARRQETSRRWWNDRRIVAAASLVFVAGVSSLVWRLAPNDGMVSEQDAVVSQPVTDSAMPVATAPASVPSELTTRDARVGAAAPVPSQASPRRLANTRAADSVAEPKVVATDAAVSRRANVAANESRRADSNAVAAKSQLADSASVQRAQRSAFEVQLQQGTAAQNQQALRQRAEQSRPAAPPAVLGAAGSRLSSVVTTGVAADMAAASRSCYQLREPRADPGIIADSVQLLSETPMQLSDPRWYRARAAGWADTALVWRSVDSTTVELRSRMATNPLVVRFSIAGLPLPLSLDAGGRAAVAVRIRCP
jgi:anti-sigma factor RsiW